jgi:hypothetical protein
MELLERVDLLFSLAYRAAFHHFIKVITKYMVVPLPGKLELTGHSQ